MHLRRFSNRILPLAVRNKGEQVDTDLGHDDYEQAWDKVFENTKVMQYFNVLLWLFC